MQKSCWLNEGRIESHTVMMRFVITKSFFLLFSLTMSYFYLDESPLLRPNQFLNPASTRFGSLQGLLGSRTTKVD